MKTRFVSLYAALLSTVAIFAASNGYALSGGTDDQAGSPIAAPDAGNSAQEPSSPGDSGGYNFSDPNFNVSVRKNETAPEATDDAESDGGGPSASNSARSPGFFGRIWKNLLDLVGTGD